MRLTQLTEGPCDVAKPEEIEKMSGTEYDKYAQWKKDCEADERTTPLSTKRMSEKAKPDFLDLDKDGDKKEPMKSAGKQKKEVCEEPQVESYSDDYDLDSNWEDDYHGDMSQEEYDQEVDNSQMEYAVWVGGTEVNDKWLTYDEAITLYDKYKAQGYDDIKLDARIKESVNEAEKRWKQTSMSPEEAIEKYGKENVKVKKGALRNGDDMVEVFVESYSPGDEYADSEGMVSNCCGAPMMDYNDGHGRCSDCKEMAAGETDEEFYESYSNDGKTVTISDYQPEGEANSHKKFNLRKQIHRSEDGKLIKSPYGGYKVSFHGNAEDVKAYAEKSLGEASKQVVESKLKNVAADIKDYVDDHKEHFDVYPMDVEVNGKVYDYDEYWKILDVVYGDEEQLDEILPVLGVAAAATAVGTGAYKVGKKIGNWASSKKTATADTLPGDGMVKKAGHELQHRKTQMSKNLAALKSESAFSKKVKEAADEDAEAVSARDDFVNMMSSKPKSSNKAIDTIKKIVADKQNQQVKFDDGKMKVDLYTASAISQVYDAVKPETQEKIDNMLRTKEGMLKLSNFAFSKLNEALGGNLNEAKEAGQLNEVIPLIPLAIGAARVLGPLALKYASKHGIKKLAKELPKVIKNTSMKTKLNKTNQIWKKTPLKKTALAYGGADYIAGDDSLKNDIKNLVKSTPFTPISTNNKPSSTTNGNDNGPSKFIKRDLFNSEKVEDDEMINEIQPEYTGADAVVDRNGKKHNPASPKAKMIINMRRKNSDNKNSNEMSPKEIKAAEIARLKALRQGELKSDRTKRSVKKGLKKGIKSLGGLAGGTGFVNPLLAASKYSPADKAMEMVEKAMDQALSEDK